jgi:16S rRNA (cytosine967-C5)-methyltransferase
MTPGGRVAAAAGILDDWLAGAPAERVLTNWARASRYAGSGDRAAVRDLVYEAIRRRRSAASLGGAETGRGLMIGLFRATGRDPDDVLTGVGHALSPMTEAERDHVGVPGPMEALDLPDWLESDIRDSLGADMEPVMRSLQGRADLFLRVHGGRCSPSEASARLAEDGITTEPHPLAPTALRVVEGPRKVQRSAAYLDGCVEIMDAASQAVAARIPIPEKGTILDYCAGGGGKALVLAARSGREIWAHDADPGRMTDLPARAERAGADIRLVSETTLAGAPMHALVVADVPCSGSGAWRRQPEAKWRLTEAALDDLLQLQRKILARCAELTAPGGTLAYMTCSLLRQENEAQADWFSGQRDDFREVDRIRLSPLEGGDGFFLAVFERDGDTGR